MWGSRIVMGLVLVIGTVACGGEVALERTAPTLPPLQLPAVTPTVPGAVGSPSTTLAAAPAVDLPEVLDISAFDLFGRLDVDRYEVAFRIAGDGIHQEAVYTYQREPEAGRILGMADGDEIEVVLIDGSVWARFGPTPGGALVEASATFAELANDFFKPGAIAAQNLEPFDFRLGDFLLVGPGEFDGRAGFEYAAAAPRVFSWWVNGEGLIIGGSGRLGDAPDGRELFFSYNWGGDIGPIDHPQNTVTQDEYFAFLNGVDPSDPSQLQSDLQEVQASLQQVRASDGAFGTDELDGMEQLGLIDGWQAGLTNLTPGVIGIELDGDSVLLVGVMADGRHYCIGMVGEAVSFGGGYLLDEVNSLAGCADPAGFPTLDPPG
ncbi:MAG: hypothetical protein JJE47_00130 [Acidimicrobiia bacterium]|nr:hypothetical protein [Acidimicrobiia bacterium]